MAQILSIYGLVCCVVMIPSINEKMALHTAFLQLGGGIAVGLCALAAGFSIGIVGDAGGKCAMCSEQRILRLATDRAQSPC